MQQKDQPKWVQWIGGIAAVIVVGGLMALFGAFVIRLIRWMLAS